MIDRRADTGPFDIVGDVHGCTHELMELLERLGYGVELSGRGMERQVLAAAPKGRRAIFVGDLVDRGPASPDALRIVMTLVESGMAMCVPGNHDARFMRWLQGRNPKLTHGLDATVAQMAEEPQEFHDKTRVFLEGLPLHLWLDSGRLVVAHAGIRQEMIGQTSDRIRSFCLYGDTDGVDAEGLPIRYHWAAHHEGGEAIVYGHTPVSAADWVNNTLCIDTGCCFGGALTAVRWPEREIVSVTARLTYAPPRRAFGHPPVRPKD